MNSADIMADKELAGRDLSEVLLKMRSAFDVFDAQSSLLKVSYEKLQQDLAASNRTLNERNRALSDKVREHEKMSSRLQCIIESLTDSVLVVNTDLRVERCNRAAERLMGRSREQIEDLPYGAVANGMGNESMLRSAMESGRAFLDNERKQAGSETEKVVLASVAPIVSADGQIFGAVEVLRDITELRHLEARMDCQKKMAALGQMAASVAHEIRNPLGTIEGFARLLKRDLAGQPDHQRLVSKIVEGAQNLNHVITNMLTFTRPASLQCEKFEAQRLLSEVRDLLTAKAAERGVILAVEESCGPVGVWGDFAQLRQVLVNLGLNAIEASARSGKVSVQASRQGSTARFVVADKGIGMTEATQQRLFEPFFTRKAGGTGLGLALCHKIVSAHAGEISVWSRPGEGSRFEVVLRCGGGQP